MLKGNFKGCLYLVDYRYSNFGLQGMIEIFDEHECWR